MKLKITEDFRAKNKRRRKLFNVAFAIGLFCLLLAPSIMNQIYNISTHETRSAITKPETGVVIPIEDRDSLISIYLISDDSIVINENDLTVLTDISGYDSLIHSKKNRNLQLKSGDARSFNTLRKALNTLIGSRHNYTHSSYEPAELDSVIRLTQ